jgi:hypothetical protein
VRYTLILVLFTTSCWSQSAPATGKAETSGFCSPAVTGNNNTFTINCGISKEQGQKIIAILNKILADKLDTDVVMAKLDEILHAVNPNIPTKVYFCGGGWRTQGPSANVGLMMSVKIDNDPSFQQMIDLANARPTKDKELLKLCTSQIEANPEWLTPRLFCAIAYARMADKAKVKAMLDIYDARKGPAYTDDSNCQQLYAVARLGLN